MPVSDGLLRGLAAVGLLAMATGCGPDRGPRSWIGERTAALRCTTSGPTRMQPALLDVPAPRAPTGLYARGLDPIALDELGFTRDRVVCAVLEAPTPEASADTAARLAGFSQRRAQASAAAITAGGRCTCEAARVLGLRELIIGCAGTATIQGCNPEDAQAAVQSSMQGVIDELATLPLPLVHWRLVGPADREGWFAEQHQDVLDRHPGGSNVYLRGQPVDARDNGPLISRLFDVEGVVAVVRQDGGRALLVVRELDDELIFDHFAYPVTLDSGLRSSLDNANPDVYIEALEKPTGTREPLLSPGKGNLVEVDRVLLDDVDAMIVAATSLSAAPYVVARELRTEPTPLVDRVAYQAPFGRDGAVLSIRGQLSEAGQAWANTLGEAPLSPTLEELGLEADVEVSFTSASDEELPFVLRGTMTNAASFHGLRYVQGGMAAVERSYPSTVHGTGAAWQFDLPRANLAGEFGADVPFLGVRDLFGQRDYQVRMSLEQGREIIAFEVGPR